MSDDDRSSPILHLSDLKPRSSWFSALPVLTTDRLILRRVRWRDAKQIHQWTSDPEVARYVLWSPHQHMSDTLSYIRYLRSQYHRGLPSSWIVEHRETGTVIGSIGYMWVDERSSSCEVGYSLARPFWNQGLATEALAAVLKFSFQTLRLHRVEAQHDTRNPASGRVMEKNGMKKEGILRDRIYNKGEFINVALYAILVDDKV